MFGNGEKKGSFFERLKEGLSKTKQSLVRNVDQMLFGEKQIDRTSSRSWRKCSSRPTWGRPLLRN